MATHATGPLPGPAATNTVIEKLNKAYEQVGGRIVCWGFLQPTPPPLAARRTPRRRSLLAPPAQVHVAYEKNFWATKMHLAGCSSEDLSASKTGYDNFLASEANLAAVREALAAEGVSPEQRHVLGIMEKTFSTYITEDPRAAQYKEKLNQLEAELAQSRNAMALGYTDPQVGTGCGCGELGVW
jgi:hypothetical protein